MKDQRRECGAVVRRADGEGVGSWRMVLRLLSLSLFGSVVAWMMLANLGCEIWGLLRTSEIRFSPSQAVIFQPGQSGSNAATLWADIGSLGDDTELHATSWQIVGGIPDSLASVGLSSQSGPFTTISWKAAEASGLRAVGTFVDILEASTQLGVRATFQDPLFKAILGEGDKVMISRAAYLPIMVGIPKFDVEFWTADWGPDSAIVKLDFTGAQTNSYGYRFLWRVKYTTVSLGTAPVEPIVGDWNEYRPGVVEDQFSVGEEGKLLQGVTVWVDLVTMHGDTEVRKARRRFDVRY